MFFNAFFTLYSLVAFTIFYYKHRFYQTNKMSFCDKIYQLYLLLLSSLMVQELGSIN